MTRREVKAGWVVLGLLLVCGLSPDFASAAATVADPQNAPATTGAATAGTDRLQAATAAFQTAIQASEDSVPRARKKTGLFVLGKVLAVATGGAQGLLHDVLGDVVSRATYAAVRAHDRGYRFSMGSLGPQTDYYREALRGVVKGNVFDTAFWAIQEAAQSDCRRGLALARCIKDPYWRALGLCEVGKTQLAYDRPQDGVLAFREAADYAREVKSEVVTAVVATALCEAAQRLRPASPDQGKALLALADTLVRDLPAKGKDEQTQALNAEARTSFMIASAAADPGQADQLARTIPDPGDRAIFYQIAAGSVAADNPELSKQFAAAGDAVLAASGDPKASEQPDYRALRDVSALLLASAGSQRAGSDRDEPVAGFRFFTEQGVRMGDLEFLEGVVRVLAMQDPETARQVVDADMARRMAWAADEAFLTREQEAQAVYSAAAGERGKMETPYNPVWESYLGELGYQLYLWDSLVHSLWAIDPQLAEDAVQASSKPAVAAAGAAAGFALTSDERARTRLYGVLKKNWDEVPGAKKGTVLDAMLFRSDPTHEERKASIRGLVGRQIAVRLARVDLPKALEVLAGTKAEYFSIREVIRQAAEEDLDHTVSTLGSCAEKPVRAGAQRYLASLAARENPDQGVTMYRQAEGTAVRFFSGPTKPGFLRAQKADAHERDMDRRGAAEDLGALAAALAASDPAKAREFAATLAGPYQRSQSYRVLALSSSPEGGACEMSLTEAGREASLVKDQNARSQAQCDLAATVGRFDSRRARQLAAAIKDPGHRAWATTMIATRLAATDAAQEEALLTEAQQNLPQIKEPKRRAYVGYVLARAWLGLDREQVLADLDAPRFEAIPW